MRREDLDRAIEIQKLKCEQARKLAHEAPLNPYRLDADGHRWVEQVSNAWAQRGREYEKAVDELNRLRDLRSSPQLSSNK